MHPSEPEQAVRWWIIATSASGRGAFQTAEPTTRCERLGSSTVSGGVRSPLSPSPPIPINAKPCMPFRNRKLPSEPITWRCVFESRKSMLLQSFESRKVTLKSVFGVCRDMESRNPTKVSEQCHGCACHEKVCIFLFSSHTYVAEWLNLECVCALGHFVFCLVRDPANFHVLGL